MLRSVLAKTIHDQWRAILIWSLFCAVWPAFYVALYPSIGGVAEVQKMLESMPPAFRALFAAEGLDLTTAEGYLNVELFSFVLPLLLMAYTVAVGGGATAGEEERGTVDLLLANPISRWRVVVDKSLAILLGTLVLCLAVWIGVVVGAAASDVKLDLVRVGGAVASSGLLGLAFGGIALAIGALTGRRMVAIAGSMGLAVVAFFVNALGTLVDWLEPLRPLSPFYHYLGNDPLRRGLDPGHAAVLLAIAVAGAAVAVVAFERRDLHA